MPPPSRGDAPPLETHRRHIKKAAIEQTAAAASTTGTAIAAAGGPGRSSAVVRQLSVESMKETEPEAPELAPAPDSSDLFK